MTLILAVPARDGVAFGSESQVTLGSLRTTAEKIYALGERVVWAGAGQVSFTQILQRRLGALDTTLPLPQLEAPIGLCIKDSLRYLANLNGLPDHVLADINTLVSMYGSDFIFASFYDDKPCVLHIDMFGQPEWSNDRPAATGNGAELARVLLSRFDGVEIGLDAACVLAYKTIDESIRVGAYGLSGPIHIWKVTADGIHKAENEDFANIVDGARILRGIEIDLFTTIFDNQGNDTSEGEPIEISGASGEAQDSLIEEPPTQ